MSGERRMNICGFFFVILTIFNGFTCTPLVLDDSIIEEFSREIQKWATEGEESPLLSRLIQEFTIPKEWQRLNWARFNGERADFMCKLCKSTGKAFLSMKTSVPEATIKETVTNLCTNLNFQTEKVCRGIINLNFPILYFIAQNDETIDENDFCGLILQDQGCDELPQRYNWTIDIESYPMPIAARVSDETIKILQITDIHYDPLYEPNGPAGCDEPVCCRKGQNITGQNGPAGFWGDYGNCDTPWHAVLDALDEMKTRHGDADLIYFTGDIIDHGVWETTHEKNKQSLLKIFRKVKETFGERPIYPIIGNHESNPMNQFAPNDIIDERLSTSWLYKLLADIWIDAGWLPESTRETILTGGYYTISPRKGFRIIAINNNMAYIYNWWLIYRPLDPTGQLKWLADTLSSAERNNEIVHILGHMPNGSPEVQHTWSQEFARIITRFSHIIAAQFNGHTHNDEFNVFYHPDDEKTIINVAWNGGSVTTYADLNPNYRTYTVNAESYAVEDAETWIYNMTEANLTPNQRPNWYKLYEFKKEYNLMNLTNTSLQDLILDMKRGGERLQKYHRNFHKYADPALAKNCDENCLQEHVCTIIKSSSNDKTICNSN